MRRKAAKAGLHKPWFCGRVSLKARDGDRGGLWQGVVWKVQQTLIMDLGLDDLVLVEDLAMPGTSSKAASARCQTAPTYLRPASTAAP